MQLREHAEATSKEQVMFLILNLGDQYMGVHFIILQNVLI